MQGFDKRESDHYMKKLKLIGTEEDAPNVVSSFWIV